MQQAYLFLLVLIFCSFGTTLSSAGTANKTKSIKYVFNKITPAPVEKFLLSEHKLITRRKYSFEELTSSYVRSLVDDELTQVKKTLQGLGYWAATVQGAIKKKEDHYAVTINIEPQELYTVSDVRLVCASSLSSLPLPTDIPELGSGASSEKILLFEHEILRHYLNSGHATASFVKKEILVDDENHKVSLLLQVDRGPSYKIGKIKIKGLERTQESFVRRRLLFAPTTVYNLSLIESTEEEIMSSGLFSHVRTETLEPQEGTIPLVIHLKEGKSRSIAFGVKVATNATGGFRAQWQNRNLTGEGDLLALRANQSSEETKAHLLYTKPDFFPDGTFLRASLEYTSEKSVAFEEQKWELYGNFEKKPYSRISLRYGGNCRFVRSHNNHTSAEDLLLTLPITVTWSSAHPQLLPKSGRSHTVHLEPHTEISQRPFTFLKVELKNSLYLPLMKRFTLALNAQAGTLMGSARRDIPLSIRYFLGSDQIMRGYPNNGLSPVDTDNNLIGGRSYYAFTLEPRIEVSDGFYFTPFVDAGQVFESSDLDFNTKLSASCGLGWHLDTLVGPLRLDIAFPLSTQPTKAPSYQIYLSIGTAF